jgi:hypothetical protein
MSKIMEALSSVGGKLDAAVAEASSAAGAAGAGGAGGASHNPPALGVGGGGGGKLDKMANMMAGGIPCGYELPMEFAVGFLFTFLIYFLVFGFVPYQNIVSTMTKYIIGFPEKMYNKILGKMPSSVRNAKSGSIFSQFNKLITKTIPDMITKEKNKMLTPLQQKLQKLKDKENSNSQNSNPVNQYIVKVRIQVMTIWQKLIHNIIPAIFVSIIYYVVWYIIFKIIPGVMKYGINMAMSLK